MIPEQGWQCPICKRVYNPRQEMCLYCKGDNTPCVDTVKISWDKDKNYWNTIATTTTTSGATKEGENYATNRQEN